MSDNEEVTPIDHRLFQPVSLGHLVENTADVDLWDSERISLGSFGVSVWGTSDGKTYTPQWDAAEDGAIYAYVVPCTSWSPYGGSLIERANCVAIKQELGDQVKEVIGGFDTTLLIVREADLRADDECLLRQFTELAEQYPLWDDEVHSQLEQQLAMEAWDDYLYMDIPREMSHAIGGEDDELRDKIDMLSPKWLKSTFYRLVGEYDYNIEAESATTVIFRDQQRIVAEMLRLVKADEVPPEHIAH